VEVLKELLDLHSSVQLPAIVSPPSSPDICHLISPELNVTVLVDPTDTV